MTALDDLVDVVISAPLTTGMSLVFDGTLWRNALPPAQCFLAEIGGVGGTLAVGDGAGVPNPVATDYTLAANDIHAILATAPAGGSTTAQVRLQPVNTLIATITFAAGANVGAVSPFAAVTLLDGQWIECVVTSIAPTPGAELTIVAQMCGPGVATTTPITVIEVGEGSILPASAASGELWRLMGHATLPDGLYWFNSNTNAWVQT